MTPSTHHYCLITPCRDESAYARRTLESVTRQSIPPALWVIVDDGSTDATPDILADYASRFDYIRILRRDGSTQRRVGPGVVDAFYAGLDTINLDRFPFLCKLDLDLDLPPRYFEILIDRMYANPRLGTCSGKPYFPAPTNRDKSFAGPLISEACGDEMSVGMTKFYRTTCFKQINGFVRSVMWDGIDCHRCRMLGWIARSWDEPDLRFIHLRPMGASHRGILTGRARHGQGQYFMGTDPLYMLASATYRMTRRPYILGGAAMLVGYTHAMLTRHPRYDDPTFRRFLRNYQRQCLIKGKQTATQTLTPPPQ
ncbi:glycosyltransferase family 2 protein [Phycisphaerales bacterium AB-hyl4]|uniref:Glycosyltransferase family 2 protein n=1 Tax=Natronomicrosphaera hydrolytica TaxID=3242702 RepID=A0ABV4U676_9BACT